MDSLPDRDLYRVRGPVAYLLHGGQAAALVLAVWTANQVGIPEMLGATGLSLWLRGEDPLSEPEAQGPALDASGAMRATGPFAWARHPLNVVPLMVIWLSPRMTENLLAFNVVGSLYLFLGSFHEETRVEAAYGDAYRDYQQSGISFYFPCPRHRP